MEKILHIGLHKTGTTSLQIFMWRNRQILLDKYSILYPKTGKPTSGHSFGQHQIPDLLIKLTSLNSIKFQDIKETLNKEIKETKPDKLLISSEIFSLLNANKIKFIKDLFDPDKIICYFRRQDLQLESQYKESIKNIRSKIHMAFEEFKKRRTPRLNYQEIILLWQTAFPEAKIIPRIYDRKLFPEGNVILDFLSILGIEMPEAREQKIEANLSLSHLSTLVLRKINEKFDLSTEEHKKVVKYLLQLDKEEGSPLKTFFTLEERLEFLEHFKESNERLFREWFNSENKFVLSDEEIKFYEEQDRILKEDAENMVEDRYRKVITYLMEERITPKGRIVSIKRPEINYHPTEEIEFLTIDVLQADLLKEGRLNIGGLVLLKKEIEGDYKLIVKDGEVEKEVRWGLPSPGLVKKYPHNPKAKNARFEVKNIRIRNRVEIFLSYDNDSKRLIEIELV